MIELDEFKNQDQKYLAEVEFLNNDDAKKFIPPERFWEEVTWDKKYENAELAKKKTGNKKE